MQSRTMSLIEALMNVLVGYGVAVATQVVVFPLFGLHASLDQNLAIGMIFTVVSLIRSYALRRVFNLIACRSLGASKRIIFPHRGWLHHHSRWLAYCSRERM